MQTTGIFTIHEYEINIPKINEPISLYPFGDVHRSSYACDVDRWHDFLAEAKADKNAYFLGLGDYDDCSSTSERELLCNKKLHESTRHTLEDVYNSHNAVFADEIQFMEGRLIGLIEGNHYGEYEDGTTTTMKLSGLMKTKYLGVASFVRLHFNYHGARTSLDIWAHHGKGAARLPGGSLNRVIQMAETADADIYFMGHDHKKAAGYVPKLCLKNTKNGVMLKHKRQLFARTGSFLKGYEPGHRSYVVDAAMGPTDLGFVKISLIPKITTKDGVREFHIDLKTTL
jgi:hypothetical protein